MKHFIIQHYTTLYNRRLVILMYKVKYGLIPGNVSDLFINKDTRYLVRNSDFELPRFNTVCYGKHSVRYLGPFLWSKLSILTCLVWTPLGITSENKISPASLTTITNVAIFVFHNFTFCIYRINVIYRIKYSSIFSLNLYVNDDLWLYIYTCIYIYIYTYIIVYIYVYIYIYLYIYIYIKVFHCCVHPAYVIGHHLHIS